MKINIFNRISGWVLWLVVIISAVLLGLFYFGGLDAPLNGEWKNPTYTSHVLIWCYVLLGLCAASLLLFGLGQFIFKLITKPKSALTTLGVFAAFAVLIIVAYNLGSGDKLPGINADLQQYNTPFWLKITDTWLYSFYILLILTILAIIWGAIQKLFTK
jgi:hypothetical protein